VLTEASQRHPLKRNFQPQMDADEKIQEVIKSASICGKKKPSSSQLS
jgi:hypothetical protein